MIVLVHDFNKVIKIEGIHEDEHKIVTHQSSMTKMIYELASYYPEEIIVWCNESAYSILNRDFIEKAFPHNRYIYSYNPSGNFFPDVIGYIEESPFINVNKEVRYPTWQMSSVVGAIKASTVLLTDRKYWEISYNLDFVLNSIAKLYQPLGMFCYSEPQLIAVSKSQLVFKTATSKELFCFVSKHYKWVWKYILFFNLLLYNRQFPIFPWLISLFKNQIKTNSLELVFEDTIESVNLISETIDVIIPTIGRKTYLYNVLKDLSVQTHLPKNVIIVEQNPKQDSESELDYIHNEVWPFQIKHIFTHHIGACNARNLALNLVNSNWCFFADDDIRFDCDLIFLTIKKAYGLNKSVLNLSCLQLNENKTLQNINQWFTFGSGCSIVKKEVLNGLKYNLSFEFGYGEDADFGMQIRNNGFDIIYLPEPVILHLKAPMGGFRTKPVLDWHEEKIAPKPSPTVMLFGLLHKTKSQLLGYKTILFFKYYKVQSIKNPLAYYKMFQKQWQISIKWAKILQRKNEL